MAARMTADVQLLGWANGQATNRPLRQPPEGWRGEAAAPRKQKRKHSTAQRGGEASSISASAGQMGRFGRESACLFGGGLMGGWTLGLRLLVGGTWLYLPGT